LGLGAKLNMAFITVVLTMVIGFAGYSFVLQYLGVRSAAEHLLDQATGRLAHDFDQAAASNQTIAAIVARDPAFTSAYAQFDRTAVANALSSIIDRTGFDGFITILDSNGVVFYSTETPARHSISVRAANPGIDFAIDRNQNWSGPAEVSTAGTVSITTMVPVNGGTGIIATSHPLNNEFISAAVMRYGIGNNRISPLEIAVVSASGGQLTAITPDLLKNNDGFLSKVAQDGFKSLPSGTFDTGNLMWRNFVLSQGKNNTVGSVLVATPLENVWWKIRDVLQQAAIIGGIALALGFFFSATLAASINSSLNFLIQRTRDLAAQKPVLASLEGLSGEWLELAEFIDTAVSSLRTTIANLKNQLLEPVGTTSSSASGSSKSAQGDGAAGGQLDNLNKQLTTQSKQLGEFSRQLQFANQQIAQSKQKLNAVLNTSTDGFLTLDPAGKILSASPAFLSWAGVGEAELAGRNYLEIVHRSEEGPGSSQVLPTATPTSPEDFKSRFTPDSVVHSILNNKPTELFAQLAPISIDGKQIAGWIISLHDKSLGAESAQLRSDIVSLLSDSIRKPLTDIEPAWLNVIDTTASSMNPSAGQQLAEIHNHYKQLLSVVDSLLMVYGGFVPQPVVPRERLSVSRLIKDTLEEVAAVAAKQKVTLDYKTTTGLPSLYTDRDTIHRILLQILEKILSVTESGGHVRIESLLHDKEMRISILSSGPALSQGDIADMFDGFIEGKHDEGSYRSRISLYMARNSVERLGGKIWAESVKGKGAAIYFKLPVE
jgi:signal transduction histidine kinase